MLFKKDFLRDDDGVIRFCDRNIAKMNLLECIIFFFIIKKDYKQIYELPIHYTWEILKNTFWLIVNLVLIIFLPIVLIYQANKSINRSNKECEKLRKIREGIANIKES